MGKIKIHEIAKKLGLTSKEIIEKATKLGIDVKNHLSSVEENVATKIEENLEEQNNVEEKSENIKRK